jgi:hypothetical protein
MKVPGIWKICRRCLKYGLYDMKAAIQGTAFSGRNRKISITQAKAKNFTTGLMQ